MDSAAEIFRWSAPTELVAVDEAQFLDPEVVTVATALAARGVRVIVAGTDTDFRGEAFGSMGNLMAVAETVDKLQAICVICGDLATRNQRLVDGKPARYDSPTIMIGGRESYEARCRHCRRVPRKDEDQNGVVVEEQRSAVSHPCSTSPSPATSPPANPPSPELFRTGGCDHRRRPDRQGSPTARLAGPGSHRDAFGSRCDLPDGQLDRGKVRQIVMRDPEARADLNAIVHPKSTAGGPSGWSRRNGRVRR